MPERRRVGLLGGSFDPVHVAHLLVAQAALERLALAEVRFVVAREQPFKQGRHGASPAERAAMVALAIAGEPRFRLELIELGRAGPSYTVETLRALRERDAGTDFTLLVGADAAAELAQWREAQALPGLARIVAFGRAAALAPESLLIGGRLDVPALDVSASEVRARVRRGASIRYWVPDAVAAFIAARGLYVDGDG